MTSVLGSIFPFHNGSLGRINQWNQHILCMESRNLQKNLSSAFNKYSQLKVKTSKLSFGRTFQVSLLHITKYNFLRTSLTSSNFKYITIWRNLTAFNIKVLLFFPLNTYYSLTFLACCRRENIIFFNPLSVFTFHLLQMPSIT